MCIIYVYVCIIYMYVCIIYVLYIRASLSNLTRGPNQWTVRSRTEAEATRGVAARLCVGRMV